MSAPAPGEPPVPILVVLPSPPARLLALSALREAVARLGRTAAPAEAGSAFEALWLLGRGRPAVALVALDLPVLSGDELVALLRARPEHRDLPVIAVAAETDADAPRRAREAGAAALVRTPIEAGALAEALAAIGLPGAS